MGDRRAHAQVLEALEEAAQVCACMHEDMDMAVSSEREAKSTLLRAIAEAVAPAIEAISDGRADVHEPGVVHQGMSLVNVGNLKKGARLYLGRREGDQPEVIFVREADDASYHRVSSGEIVRELDLPALVRRLAERMRASITGAAPRRTEDAQTLAEKLFALEVLLRS